jgi:phosphohistidine phosphatase
MIRNIIICRHAEASFSSPALGDFGRPLTHIGQEQARLAGQWLKKQGLETGAFISSPAVRAKESALALAAGIGWPEDQVIFKQKMYQASPGELVAEIAALDSLAKSVVLVGHNPAVSALSSQLCEDDSFYLDPANIVVISLWLEKWPDLFHRQGLCAAHFKPSEI